MRGWAVVTLSSYNQQIPSPQRPTMAITYEQFTQRLIAAGLISADELREFVDKLPPANQGKDPQALARELIVAGKLTKHQATAIYKGETKGLVLGNYVILDKLGAGGMGEVYRARHKVMEREVALKVLPAKLIDSPDAVKRFQREVRAAAKLEHPNIVIAHDADQAAGRHFLVMQFVDGKDLSTLVREHGPLSIEEAIDCCLQAARGLAYAHSKGVIHRDIKPSNLLLHKAGTVKILDMGLARIQGQIEDQSALGALTQSGQIMGTVDYMAPEQAENTRVADHRADIYSLGCTLYVLLTARAPFVGDTLLQKMMAHQQKPVPKLSDARGDASLALDAVLARMLAKKPEERYQTMDEVIVALQTCLAPERAHAAGALAAGSSDSHLTALLDKLAAGEKRSITTRVAAAVARHEETINKKPQAHADDTGTGITRPPRAAAQVDVAKQAPKPVANSRAAPLRRNYQRLMPLALVGGGVLSLGLLAGVSALLVWQPWNRTESPGPGDHVNPPISGTPAADEWLDLLALIDGEQDSVAGKWVVEQGKLRLVEGANFYRVAAPVVPDGDYRLAITFSAAPTGALSLLVPVGEESGRLVIAGNESKEYCGLDLDFIAASDPKNPTRTAALPFDPAKKQRLVIDVKRGRFQADIVASVDGKRLFQWQGLPTQLDDTNWRMPDRRQLGFAPAQNCVIHAARLQMLSGKAILLRRAPVNLKLPTWAVAPHSDSPLSTVSLSPAEILVSPDWDWTEPENLGPGVNTAAGEYDAALSADAQCLVFSSRRVGTGQLLYESRRTSAAESFGPAKVIDGLVPDDGYAAWPYLSADGLTLVFGSNRPGGRGDHDLWIATRARRDGAWGEPKNLGATVNSTLLEKYPALSSDGLTLYFSSDRDGNPDLYLCRRASLDEEFGPAQRLGAEINTAEEEGCPRPLADGQSFAFTRNPVASYDWLLATPSEQGRWQVGTIRSFPTGTDKSYYIPWFAPDGRTVYFHATTDRASDLWMMRREPKAKTAGLWQSLFNGKDLANLTVDRPKAWKVEDGVLVGEIPQDQPSTVLYTPTKHYRNLHMRLEAQYSPSQNGMVYFRVGDGTWNAYGVTLTGDGSDIAIGSLFSTIDITIKRQANRVELTEGQWYTLEIIVDENRIRTLIDGVDVVDFTDPDAARYTERGQLLLQLKPGTLKIRKWEVKELP